MQYWPDNLHADRQANAILLAQLGEGRYHLLGIILRLNDGWGRQQFEILKQNTVGLSKLINTRLTQNREHANKAYSIIQTSK